MKKFLLTLILGLTLGGAAYSASELQIMNEARRVLIEEYGVVMKEGDKFMDNPYPFGVLVEDAQFVPGVIKAAGYEIVEMKQWDDEIDFIIRKVKDGYYE